MKVTTGGGSWNSVPENTRVAHRGRGAADHGYAYRGFRLVAFPGSDRSLCGGGWWYTLAFARVANHSWSATGVRLANLGFRLVGGAR